MGYKTEAEKLVSHEVWLKILDQVLMGEQVTIAIDWAGSFMELNFRPVTEEKKKIIILLPGNGIHMKKGKIWSPGSDSEYIVVWQSRFQ